MKLLLVEDHSGLALNIFDYFEPKGYQIDWARDGEHGYELAVNQNHDLIILDIMLPKSDGFEVCKKIREYRDMDIPIIMLTALDHLEDRIQGLDLGADDYLSKPFELRELESRIKSVMRRYKGLNYNKILTFKNLQVTPNTYEVIRDNQVLSVPPIAFKILCLLLRNKHRITTFKEIEGHIWGDSPPASSSLRTHIHTLRTIIDKPFAEELIITVPKIGLKLNNESNL